MINEKDKINNNNDIIEDINNDIIEDLDISWIGHLVD